MAADIKICWCLRGYLEEAINAMADVRRLLALRQETKTSFQIKTGFFSKHLLPRLRDGPDD